MHKIMEKPIISYIILFVVFYVLQMTIESFLRQALINITPLYGDAISSIISVAVIAIIYILIFKFNKMFSLKNFKLGFILIIPTFAYALINVFNPGFGAGSVETLIAIILLGFSIGLCEEVLFRGILISNLMKLIKNKDKIFIKDNNEDINSYVASNENENCNDSICNNSNVFEDSKDWNEYKFNNADNANNFSLLNYSKLIIELITLLEQENECKTS